MEAIHAGWTLCRIKFGNLFNVQISDYTNVKLSKVTNCIYESVLLALTRLSKCDINNFYSASVLSGFLIKSPAILEKFGVAWWYKTFLIKPTLHAVLCNFDVRVCCISQQ